MELAIADPSTWQSCPGRAVPADADLSQQIFRFLYEIGLNLSDCRLDITEMTKIREPLVIVRVPYQLTYLLYKLTAWTQYHIFDMYETPIYWKFFSTYDLNPLFLL